MKAHFCAFTLIELLVVIAIIAILAAILLPVLQAAKARGQTAVCIDHQKQLVMAWLMYATDNKDACAGNWWQHEQDWPAYPRENWISGWVDPTGSAPNSASGTGDDDSTNTALLVNSQYTTLGDYIKNPGVFLCPASIVIVKAYPGDLLVRSVSMNQWMGYNTMGYGTSQFATLDNFPGYKVFAKVTDITAGLGPADAFVFMEERGESIDDGWFAIAPTGNQVDNMPTDYHNGAATVGFADGHVEVHGWQNANGLPANQNFLTPQQASCPKWKDPIGSVLPSQPGGLYWLQQHATFKTSP